VAEPGAGGPVRGALFRLADLLEAEGVVYMIVGALAVAVWGRPRATADIDVTLQADAGQLEMLAGRAERVGFAVDREWLDWQPLLRDRQRRLTAPGAIVDLMRPRDAHEEAALGRRRHVAFEGRQLPFVAPDDLVLMKLKAGRPRDFEDAVSVLTAQGGVLDTAYLWDWAGRLGVGAELDYVLRAIGDSSMGAP
jgi:hypothetical protein